MPGTYQITATSHQSDGKTASAAASATALMFPTWPVIFNESGLPSGAYWSVTIGGQTNSSMGSAIGFIAPTGSFAFSVETAAPEYVPDSSSGTFEVAGHPASVPVAFESLAEENLNVQSIDYQPYTEIAGGQPQVFTLEQSSGDTGISFGVMGGTATFHLTQGSVLVDARSVTACPINYDVTTGSDSFAYVNFIGNGTGLELSVTVQGSTPVLVAYNEYSGPISNWTASMITYPPQFALNFATPGTQPVNTGMSFTLTAPTYSTPLPLAIWVLEGFYNATSGDGWSAQVGFNDWAGNDTVSYAGWGGFSNYLGANPGGTDYGLPLTPGASYNFTMELVSGTTWEFLVNGNPINEPGIGYTWNTGTTTSNVADDFGIETLTADSASVNVTHPVMIPTAVEYRINGQWQRASSLLFDVVGENWWNGNTSVDPGIDLWGVEGHLENHSLAPGSIELAQELCPVYAPAPLGNEPMYGPFKVSPTTAGSGVVTTSANYSAVAVSPESPPDWAGVYQLDSSGNVLQVTNEMLRTPTQVPTLASARTAEVFATSLSLAPTTQSALSLPRLSSVSATPSSGSLPIGTAEVFLAISHCSSGRCPSGITYSWNLTDTLGTLNASSGSSVTFTAGTTAGTDTLFVNATLDGVTQQSAPVRITIVASAPVPYSVTFTESGLPSGVSWSVTLGDSTLSSTTGAITYTEPNGTYSYTIGLVPGWTTSPRSGAVTVNGTAASVSMAWMPVTYAVTFEEKGLGLDTTWWVDLNSTIEYSTTGSVLYSDQSAIRFIGVANGSYGFSVNAPGYSAIPASGVVTVDGSNASVFIAFSPPTTYSITFSEVGLPSGTSWSIALSGSTRNSTTSSITFTEPNGTYTYAIADVSGWHQTTLPYTGSVTVNGAATTEETLAFTQVTYTVTFTETGLPSGTSWSVTLGGSMESSTMSAIAFTEPNGTYTSATGGVTGYVSPGGGLLRVYGANVSLFFTFFARESGTYLVTFTEGGLPPLNESAQYSETWTVNVIGNGTNQTLATIGTSVTLQLLPGSYVYTLGAIIPYSPWPDQAGSITIAEENLTVDVEFAFTYAVMFVEAGVPDGTDWSLQVTETATGLTDHGGPSVGRSWFVNSTAPTASLRLANGTYAWTITASGYQRDNGSGLTVSGQPVSKSVTITPSSSTASSSAPFPWTYVIIGIAVTVVVAGVAIALVRRSRRG